MTTTGTNQVIEHPAYQPQDQGARVIQVPMTIDAILFIVTVLNHYIEIAPKQADEEIRLVESVQVMRSQLHHQI